MNTQEIFDTVVAHLRKQGKKAMRFYEQTSREACAYRSPEGLSCAFGCLMTDEEYKPSFEGLSVMGVLNKPECPQSLKDRLGITEEDLKTHYSGKIYLLQALQNIHDTMEVSEWEDKLKLIAEENGLKYTAPSVQS